MPAEGLTHPKRSRPEPAVSPISRIATQRETRRLRWARAGSGGPTLSHTPPATALHVVVVDDEQQFLGLRDAWNRLAEARDNPSVFLFHEWFLAAWEWRKQGSSLFVLCAYMGDCLVGVLPLVLSTLGKGWLGTRRAELLTVPDTQLCDLVVARTHAHVVATAMAAELRRHRSRWDHLRMDYLASDAVAAHAFRLALEALGFRTELRGGARNLMIALDTSWADYYGGRSRSLKKANNLAANRLKKKGEVTIEWLRPDTSEFAALEAGINAVIEISRRSWKQETGTSLDQPGPGAFVRRLSWLAAERGWLSLWTLKLNGEPLATEYQLIYNGNVHALRADFDAGCLEISPGSRLSHHLLERLFGEGLKRYYMGPGENPYKLRWSSAGDELSQVLVYGRTLRGRYAWLRDAVLKKKVKQLKIRLRRAKEPSDASDAPSDAILSPEGSPKGEQ